MVRVLEVGESGLPLPGGLRPAPRDRLELPQAFVPNDSLLRYW